MAVPATLSRTFAAIPGPPGGAPSSSRRAIAACRPAAGAVTGAGATGRRSAGAA